MVKEVLGDYIGKDIAINYREPGKYRRAVLAELFDHHFTIHPFNDQTTYHIPITRIQLVQERVDGEGFRAEAVFGTVPVNLAITIRHQFVPKGSSLVVGLFVSE